MTDLAIYKEMIKRIKHLSNLVNQIAVELADDEKSEAKKAA
jgi:hypothetical protein